MKSRTRSTKKKKSALNQKRVFSFIVILLLILTIPITVLFSQRASHYQQQAAGLGNIVIDYATPLRKLDPLAIGMDISGYFTPNVFASDTVEQQKVKTLGTNYLRMHLVYKVSGDPTSQIQCGGNGCMTSLTGDQWVNAIKSIGATPVIVIYTKSAVDAANMVKHFNSDTHNPVHYWIVGNEPNINGYSVQSYSSYFNQDYDAMKAIDPSIQIGGGTTAWYDSFWLKQFLQLSGSRVDFVDFHGYPQQGTTPGNTAVLFQHAQGYGRDVASLQALIQATVPGRAAQIFTEVGEWELNWGGGAQDDTNFHALWAASSLGNILKAGGRSLFYADKGNALYGNAHVITDAYGHIVTVGLDTTNAAYHGMGMFTGEGLFPHFGDTMVTASTTLPNVEVFASDNPKNIVVINEDPAISQVATVSLNGLVSGTADVWRKDESVLFPNPPVHLGSVTIQNGNFTYPLPPFSVTTFVISPSGAIPTTPFPTVTALTPTSPIGNQVTPTITLPMMTATPSQVHAGTTIASDTFQRQNQRYWGTATDGSIWQGEANTGSIFSLVNGTAQVGNGYGSHNAIIGPSVTNAQIVFSGSMSSFEDTNLGGVVRWQDTQNWYKAYIDGGNLVLQKNVHGTTKILRMTPFKAIPGTSYTVKFQVVGQALSAKVWQTATVEPTDWMATEIDSSLQFGYCGLRMLIQTGKTATYTSFTAMSL